MAVPEKVFFTRGSGSHTDKLISFELALRNARLAPYNLVTVSSIMPPETKIISCKEGLTHLSPGEIVYCVMARMDTNIPGQNISAAIGLAIPEMHKKQHGYLSEYHAIEISERECGEYAENLAATMLATTMGTPLEKEATWQQQEQMHLTIDRIIKTSHFSASATGDTNGKWTTVLVAAVFILP